MVSTASHCDSCGKKTGTTMTTKIYRLDTGGGSGVFLCRTCWAKEMKWRKARNKTLHKGAQFHILKFPGSRRRSYKKKR